jgi:hypothetical protein
MPLPQPYDWNRIRTAIRQLEDAFPGLLENIVLIGGGASWFYREALRQWNDPVFRVPQWTDEEEAMWLSKDVDFMGLDEAEATDLLQTPFNPETHTFHFRGLELDFLEEGLTLTRQNAVLNRRTVRLPEVTFYVVEATLLYAEKTALLRAKQRPQDELHHRLLAEFLKCEFCRDIEGPGTFNPSRWVARARAVKTSTLDFFRDDERFRHRLRAGIAKLNPDTHKAVLHWANHHLPDDNQVS